MAKVTYWCLASGEGSYFNLRFPTKRAALKAYHARVWVAANTQGIWSESTAEEINKFRYRCCLEDGIGYSEPYKVEIEYTGGALGLIEAHASVGDGCAPLTVLTPLKAWIKRHKPWFPRSLRGGGQ
tara:strand:- start:2133 stop:2510 length:378 start_codon:yes stop_codon:yes gene_type:complete